MGEGRSLFDPVVDAEQMNPAFVVVATSSMSEATRRMMDESFQRMPIKEPHFVEQFQTSGFDQRVWELGLFVSLVELGFHVEMPSPAPDFACMSGDAKFFIEATTANAPMVDGKRIPPPRTVEEFKDRLRVAVDVDKDEIAIRMGSALFSKAQRAYHKLDHVRGHPLVLAIEPFFDVGALWRSETALVRYLYGTDIAVEESSSGRVVLYDKVVEHQGRTKAIPSGFFREAENSEIAAVMFSNSHTTGKFSRMGFQLGYGPKDRRLIRRGYAFDHDPNALAPQEFAYEVGTWEEPWPNGLVVMHNPNAHYPVDRGLFKGVSQTWEDEGRLNADMANPHIYTSVTDNIPR